MLCFGYNDIMLRRLCHTVLVVYILAVTICKLKFQILYIQSHIPQQTPPIYIYARILSSIQSSNKHENETIRSKQKGENQREQCKFTTSTYKLDAFFA